jgi:beta-phosphoglucomutase
MPLSAAGKPLEGSDPRGRTDEEVGSWELNTSLSAISNQQSAISNQQSAISNQQSAISNKKMPLRAIVFDFDGVIANSEPLHFRAFQDVLASENIRLTESDYYARYLGYDDVGVFQAIGAAHGRGWNTRQIADLVAQKALAREALERASVLFPGAADAVRRAAAAFPVAIASGALGIEIRRVLDRERLTTCFAAIVAAEDTPVSKPAPDPYLHAVAQLRPALGGDLDEADCVAVEDSHWGLESARAAGLRTVGVAQTYEPDALSDADLVIRSIADLDLHVLARLFSE